MIVPLLRLQGLSSAHLSPILNPRRVPPRIFSPPRCASTGLFAKCHQDVLRFWFEDLSFEDWFKSDPELDATIRNKFEDTLVQAAACELDAWRKDADGALAEIIVLDQFSRNIYRNTPRAFAQDPMALSLSQVAIAKGYDKDLDTQKQMFLYMPFMHSESRVIHERGLELFQAPGLELSLDFAKQHKAIIDRFGRYPYRNEILGRESRPDEDAFLNDPESKWW